MLQPSLPTSKPASSSPWCDLHYSGYDKVYSTPRSSTGIMTSAPSDNFLPRKTLDTAIRESLAREEKLYHDLKNQKLAQQGQMNDARSSSRWLGSALDVTRVVLKSSADVVSVLDSFVDTLYSVISIHGSDQIFGDLKQSLPSADAAKRTWESVAAMVEIFLVQIESLKSTTSSHTECMGTELEAHKIIEQQSQISLDSLTQSIDALTYSMDHKHRILSPIRRVPTEILWRIFELSTLDERSTLQGKLVGRRTAHASKDSIYCTVPRVPTILASTCRRWRHIALNMPLLWSFLRVPTSEKYRFLPYTHMRECVVGRSTFQRAKLCIGTSKCEVVLGPTDDWSMVNQHLSSIPISQISTINIVSPHLGLDFSQIPTARVLRITRRSTFNPWGMPVPPPSYSLPASILADTRELECHHALPAVNAPILSLTTFSLTLDNSVSFPDLGHPLAHFPNLTTLVLSTDTYIDFGPDTFTPLHHSRIAMLSITDTVIPYLCASLQRGALSLPSLTHFVLDIFRSINNHGGEWSQLQPLFVNVTCFDIRAATPQNCGSNIRQLLNVMPLLQQFTVFRNAVNDGLGALLIAPIKRIGKLVVSDSKTDGSDVKSYYDALISESADSTGDNLGISIQFVNCPCILPRIRNQFSS